MVIHSIHSFFTSHGPKNNRFYTIAIDGRAGSGKTAFAEYLKRLLPEFIFLSGDDYFEPVENEIAWGAFNNKRFIKDVIRPLKKGNSFIYKPYTWNVRNNSASYKIVIEKGLCLERCYSFQMDLDWDVKIWIETPKEICLKRGVSREHMPKERVIAAWGNVWQPQEDVYINSYNPMKRADIVIDGTKAFKIQKH